MKRIFFQSALAAGLLAVFLWAAGPAAAQRPSWAGEGQKGGNSQKEDRWENQQGRGHGKQAEVGGNDYRQENRDHARHYDERQENRYQREEHYYHRTSGPGGSMDRHRYYFRDRDRSHIDRYYFDLYRRGNCPPGLAKKGNGCMPPGLAKKWVLYRPLPRNVIFYDLPGDVLVILGPPPRGHRFVRVASDILLIAVGTGMVVDAIEDLGRIY